MVKKPSRAAEPAVAEKRSHLPLINSKPSSNSAHGTTRATKITAHCGRIPYASTAIANRTHDSRNLVHAA